MGGVKTQVSYHMNVICVVYNFLKKSS